MATTGEGASHTTALFELASVTGLIAATPNRAAIVAACFSSVEAVEVCSVGGAAVVGEEEGAFRAPLGVEQLEALEVIGALEQPAAIAGQRG